MSEQYLPIPGFPGYSVSDLGNVRSEERWSKPGRGCRLLPQAVMRTTLHSSGYLKINLSKEGKIVTCLVHRLVAQTWNPNPGNLPEVDHDDTDKRNNVRSNLVWVTEAQNSKRAREKGLYQTKHSKYIGVHWHASTDRYQVSINLGGKMTYIGSSKDELEAAKIWDAYIVDNGLDRAINFTQELSNV